MRILLAVSARVSAWVLVVGAMVARAMVARAMVAGVTVAWVTVAAAGCCFGAGALSGDPAPVDPLGSEPASVPSVPMPAIDPPPPPVPVIAPGVREIEGHLSAQGWASIASGPAPQVPSPRELWDRAQPHEGALERAMVVCRARVRGGGFDDSVLAGGADVSLAARFGDGDVRRTPQTPARVYTFPIARLAPGEAIWVRVIDDDVFFDDTIAEGTTTLARAPFVLTMGQADVECRAVPSAIVAPRAEEAMGAVSRAIDRLDASEVDVTAYDLGYPRARTQPVIEAATRAAAWVEWSDPALVAQLDRARAFEDAWRERAERAIEEARERAPASGEPVEIGRGRRVTVRGIVCGRAAEAMLAESGREGGGAGCLLPITIEAGRERLRLPALGPDAAPPLEPWVIDARAQTAAVTLLARRDEGGWIADGEERAIAPGEALEIVLGVPYGFQPVLLRARDAPSRAVVMRVE